MKISVISSWFSVGPASIFGKLATYQRMYGEPMIMTRQRKVCSAISDMVGQVDLELSFQGCQCICIITYSP